MSKSTAVSGSAPSLGQRFARLQNLPGNYTPEEVNRMTMEEAGVMFGKQMKGVSYAQAVESNRGWCKRVCDHLGDSELPQHRCFLTYLERHVAEAEKTEETLVSDGPTRGRPFGPSAPGFAARRRREPRSSLRLNESDGLHESSKRVLQDLAEVCESTVATVEPAKPILPAVAKFPDIVGEEPALATTSSRSSCSQSEQPSVLRQLLNKK